MAASDRDRAVRHIGQHLQRLRSMGVEWLPAPDRTKSPPIDDRPSLFGTAEEPVLPDGSGERRIALAVLADEVRVCTACPELASTRTQTVFGVGPIGAELCFIGEAPGADEDRQGEPFVGAAGQLLNRIILACGMTREQVYICNILRCRPPGNRPPRAEEADNCRSFLERQLEIIKPRFICCLGASAANYLLGVKRSISSMRGTAYDFKGTPVICTYHPSYLLRSQSAEAKRMVWDDMKALLVRMGKPVPPSARKE